ncbi:MAG: zf-HC2 domain-containing protein [Terracidiphilus sp.]|jgi:hypothetical protein
MTACNRAPAIENAARYIEGALSRPEAEQFEDHYWNCPACLAYLQALEAVGDELAREPVPQVAPAKRKPAFAWPVLVWGLGWAAAVAVLAVVGVRMFAPLPAPTSQAKAAHGIPTQGGSAAAPVHSSPASATAAQLADLALPSFAATNLRGASGEPHFQQGMEAYGRGDCPGALAALEKVPSGDSEERKAEFYSALCGMHEGDLSGAEAGLRKIVDAGDSLQLESALYYLAQIDLARNDLAGAQHYLARTISLRGDLEHRARLQEQKVLALEKVSRDAGATDGGGK